MTTNLNKKIVIPAAATVAAVVIGLMVFTPSLAMAQNATTSSSTNNNNGSSNNNNPMTGATARPTISGSVNVKQAISNYIKDNTKVSFIDAASTAAKQVSNGQVVRGNLGIVQGYLVYAFTVVDTSNNNAYIVIVDAGNGQVLYTSPGHAVGSMLGLGSAQEGMFARHGGIMWKNHDGALGMMMHRYSNMPSQSNNSNSNNNNTTATQSSFSSSTSASIDGGYSNIGSI